MSLRLRFAVLLMVSAFAVLCSVNRIQASQPKLVLVIIIDQLRGDMALRFKDRFGEGGFRYLMDNGVVFTQAHFRHSATFTATGHASLATGGNAAQHGIAGNDWYDQASGQHVYSVEDDRHTIIGKAPKAHQGTSPRNMTSTTFGDELVLATGRRGRVFSVSIKDRGAILPGGHLGKAFWYSKGSGEFVTSTFYYDEYPGWVNAWNAAKHADRYRDKKWTLLNDRRTYVYSDQDDRPCERSYKQLGRTFPHPLENPKPEDYYSALRYTPMSDELTLDFAKVLLDKERLGQGDQTDVLAISFSATDYLGHAFGPNSLEMEDNVLRVDRLLTELFDLVENTLGLANTLIVLTGDHGIDASPEYMQSLGIAAGRHYPDKFMDAANAGLQERFNTDQKLVIEFWNPSLYLDTEAITGLGLDLATVERALAEEILRIRGFAYAVTRTDLLAGDVGSDPILAKVQRAFHSRRSGNVLVVQNPSWYLYPKTEAYSAMHGSPYPYDTYVPIMFAGSDIRHRVVHRPVAPEDIACTITGYLNINPPTGSTGTPLIEVLDRD